MPAQGSIRACLIGTNIPAKREFPTRMRRALAWIYGGILRTANGGILVTTNEGMQNAGHGQEDSILTGGTHAAIT
jgi:hypothetical protein